MAGFNSLEAALKWLPLALVNIGMIDHVTLAAVAVKPLTGARIIDDILGQTQADNKADQWFAAVINGFVRRPAAREA
jgi:hypothetical protein